jgi:hypothetical protein
MEIGEKQPGGFKQGGPLALVQFVHGFVFRDFDLGNQAFGEFHAAFRQVYDFSSPVGFDFRELYKAPLQKARNDGVYRLLRQKAVVADGFLRAPVMIIIDDT